MLRARAGGSLRASRARQLRQARKRAREALRQLVHALRGARVRLLRRTVHVSRGDDLDAVPQVVEHEQRVREEEDGLRQPLRVLPCHRSGRFEVVDGLVGEVPHRSAHEPRQPLNLRGAEPSQFSLNGQQRVNGAARLAFARAQHAVGLRAHEAEARHPLAAFDALQQERNALPAARDLQVGRDGRLEVGHDLPVDRDEVVALLRQALELFDCRNVVRHRTFPRGHENSPAPHTRGGATAVPPLLLPPWGGTLTGTTACGGLCRPPVTGRSRRRLPPAFAGFGPRLRGPFGLRAGAGSHQTRLSEAPPEGVLLPIPACNRSDYPTISLGLSIAGRAAYCSRAAPLAASSASRRARWRSRGGGGATCGSGETFLNSGR